MGIYVSVTSDLQFGDLYQLLKANNSNALALPKFYQYGYAHETLATVKEAIVEAQLIDRSSKNISLGV